MKPPHAHRTKRIFRTKSSRQSPKAGLLDQAFAAVIASTSATVLGAVVKLSNPSDVINKLVSGREKRFVSIHLKRKGERGETGMELTCPRS